MNFADPLYIKTKVGHYCSARANEIQSATECKKAGERLGLQWAQSWTGPNDFPACLYADDGRNTVYFNLSPNPKRSNPNPKFSAICKTAGKNCFSLCVIFIVPHQNIDIFKLEKPVRILAFTCF